MTAHVRRPIIGVISEEKNMGDVNYLIVRGRYLEALQAHGMTPVVIPSFDISLLGKIDGVLLTGSLTNVAPSLYKDSKKKLF